jgi:hypothetical protein
MTHPLQLMLARIALVIGVTIITGVEAKHVLKPSGRGKYPPPVVPGYSAL